MRQLVITKSITQREYKSLDKYFNEISKIDMISIQEEITLSRMAREGDERALERLTKTNLRFVISVAKQYQNQGLTLGDLISEGNIGLIIAAKKYDESRGFRFISYAVWWIRQSIISAIAQHARMVRLPYSQFTLLNKIYKTNSKLEQEYDREPSAEELAECMELSVEKISEAINKSGASIPIDDYIKDSDYTLLDILPSTDPSPDRLVEHDAIAREIHDSLKILSKRDRDLLVMYYGLGAFAPLPMEEIGKRLNITKEHVGRLREKALARLRNCSNSPVLMSCLS